jgi:FkbM family methyltransferase
MAALARSLGRVRATIRWGQKPSDRAKIGLYYALRFLTGVARPDHDFSGGMYPRYWIGDVTVTSPIGIFRCRANTVDFDIVNPNFESREVAAFRDRLAEAKAPQVVCLDVGAHIGKFSVLAARLLNDRGIVLAFEPEPSNYAGLLRNISMNGLRNVRCFPMALGREDGTALLSRSTTNIGAHTLMARRGAETLPVPVRALDRVLPEIGISRVDVLKLDVEYMEAEVLQGAVHTLASNPGIIVFFEETANPDSAASVRLLESLGFTVQPLGLNVYEARRGPPENLVGGGRP